jgi:hypothetical protein
MAAGASAARGDWLLFLHPETALESGWENEAQAFVDRSVLERPRAATFRFAIDDFGNRARRIEILARLRSAIFGLPNGDQGLLLPKRFYRKLGGHGLMAMEDIDLVRRVGRRRLVVLRSRAINKVSESGSCHRAKLLMVLHAFRIPRNLVAFIGD